MERYVSAAEFSRLSGRTRQAIGKAVKEGRLKRDEKTGLLDLQNATNRDYLRDTLNRLSKQSAEPSRELEDDENDRLPADASPEARSLYDLKTKKQIEKLEQEIIRIELQNETVRENLVPFDVVSSGWGAFAAGIRNNFLPIGNRVARGDVDLRDKIENEIQKAIQKTIESTAAELRESVRKGRFVLEVEGE